MKWYLPRVVVRRYLAQYLLYDMPSINTNLLLLPIVSNITINQEVSMEYSFLNLLLKAFSTVNL